MWTIFLTILLFAILLTAVLISWSPGVPSPVVDEYGKLLPGSLSEKTWVEINGIQQGMFIKSKDISNPVLLYVHGGPGMPDILLEENTPSGLEEYFTVCWWEQRGTGLSYDSDIPIETMTVDQMVSDTITVTNYLRTRFDKEKIYLMGHSWGTYIAIQAAAQAPDLYHAYIGVAQIANQLESENLAYDVMLQQFKENDNRRMVRKMEAVPLASTVPLPEAYLGLRDEAMHSLGVGTTHAMKSVISGIFLPSWKLRSYTLGEKINIWRGKLFSRSLDLWDTMLSTDMSKEVPEVDIPVYFIHGIYDYTVAYPVTKTYYEKIKAPVKGFYTFGRSAHSPNFEEPEKFREIIRQDILTGRNGLADND